MRAGAWAAIVVSVAALGCAATSADVNAERIERGLQGEPFRADTPGASGIAVESAPPLARRSSPKWVERSGVRYRRYVAPSKRSRSGRVDHRSQRSRGAAATVR